MNRHNEYHPSEYPFHMYQWERVAAALGMKLIKKLYQRHGKRSVRIKEVLFEQANTERVLSVYDNGGEVNLFTRPKVLAHPANPSAEYTRALGFSVPYTVRILAINEETLAYRIKTALAGGSIDYNHHELPA